MNVLDFNTRRLTKTHTASNYWVVMKDIVTVRSNTRRFYLVSVLFLFHKFTGISAMLLRLARCEYRYLTYCHRPDSLNYFAPEIFEMIRVHGESNTLLATGV